MAAVTFSTQVQVTRHERGVLYVEALEKTVYVLGRLVVARCVIAHRVGKTKAYARRLFDKNDVCVLRPPVRGRSGSRAEVEVSEWRQR